MPQAQLEEEDELMFGHFCFSCGNASQGNYCSAECRAADGERVQTVASPDLSPSLYALPGLIRTKSVASTPTSSATNSPSPLSGMSQLALEDEPPALNLPPSKFTYGAASLPALGAFAQPSVWSMQLQDPIASTKNDSRRSSVGTGAGESSSAWDELKYVRRASGRSAQAVPAPLYFRQTAAAVHSSPMLGPSSPAGAMGSPGLRPAANRQRKNSLTSLHNFALPPPLDLDAATPSLPATDHCGRPGCVGASVVPGPRKSGGAATESLKTSRGSSSSLHLLGRQDNDLLMSPRIRALRGHSVEHSPQLASSSGSDETDSSLSERRQKAKEGQHSAFACYLFAHLNETAKPHRTESEAVTVTRGRPAVQAQPVPETQRSLSVDSVIARSSSGSRPPRFLFSRGNGAGRLEPLAAVDDDEDATATLRPAPQPVRPSIAPGHFIQATSATPDLSSYASPQFTPLSPPTFSRGRSSNRRNSDPSPSQLPVGTPADRGRSHARLGGATHRAASHHREDDSDRSASRGRVSRTHSRAPSPVARDSRSRGRVSRPASPDSSRGRESISRGRHAPRDEPEVEEEDGDDRGRGRGRGTDSRSRSAAPRGRSNRERSP